MSRYSFNLNADCVIDENGKFSSEQECIDNSWTSYFPKDLNRILLEYSSDMIDGLSYEEVISEINRLVDKDGKKLILDYNPDIHSIYKCLVYYNDYFSNKVDKKLYVEELYDMYNLKEKELSIMHIDNIDKEPSFKLEFIKSYPCIIDSKLTILKNRADLYPSILDALIILSSTRQDLYEKHIKNNFSDGEIDGILSILCCFFPYIGFYSDYEEDVGFLRLLNFDEYSDYSTSYSGFDTLFSIYADDFDIIDDSITFEVLDLFKLKPVLEMSEDEILFYMNIFPIEDMEGYYPIFLRYIAREFITNKMRSEFRDIFKLLREEEIIYVLNLVYGFLKDMDNDELRPFNIEVYDITVDEYLNIKYFEKEDTFDMLEKYFNMVRIYRVLDNNIDEFKEMKNLRNNILMLKENIISYRSKILELLDDYVEKNNYYVKKRFLIENPNYDYILTPQDPEIIEKNINYEVRKLYKMVNETLDI